MSSTCPAKPNLMFQVAPTLGSEMIVLRVGLERKEFTIHKALACDSVKFFKAAFENGFAEAKDDIMELPEDKPETISLLVDWIYRRTIPEGYTAAHVHTLFDLYVFADKICEPILKDQIVDCIQDMGEYLGHVDILFTQELFEKIKHIEMRGLKHFIITFMAYLFLLKGQAELDIEEEEGVDKGSPLNFAFDNRKPVYEGGRLADWISKEDLKIAWDALQGDFELFAHFQSLVFLGYRELEDPRHMRSIDRCFYHCHGKDEQCHYPRV
ncbi:hypothetical protein VTL71DRAFT_12064 [Oculimacula yallundae]|uniref:BTB domain-containing protein n=1 Tax=Oculimacula yallundae TaxID=86028 RepID=A0ABR4CU92_9HELO